jgi:CBS domain-containing protein
MKVERICQQDIVTVHPDMLIPEAAHRMTAHSVGCVVVVREGALHGILTDRDIVVRGVRTELDLARTTVGELMSRPLVTIDPDADVADAIALMAGKGIRRLPVVDADGDLVGVLSLDDLAAVVGNHVALLRTALTATLAR